MDDSRPSPPPQYERILERSRQLQFSMNSDLLTGSLLRTLSAARPGGSFLELGTGCGLGTCWLLEGMDSRARLISIDNDPQVQAVAREELGDDPRLRLVLEDGARFLQNCGDRFDFIYADALPGKDTPLQNALDLLNTGGMYLIDDMLPQPNWPDDHPPKVVALLETLDRLQGFAITKLAWSTGVVMCVKR